MGDHYSVMLIDAVQQCDVEIKHRDGRDPFPRPDTVSKQLGCDTGEPSAFPVCFRMFLKKCGALHVVGRRKHS